MGFWEALFGLQDAQPAPAAPVAPRATPVRGRIAVPSPDGGREYETADPFWASIAKMQPGTFARYKSVNGEWHVFQIEGGPEYGRKAVPHDVSLVVQRISTGVQFTMPADKLYPCDADFVQRDGTPVI